VIARWLRSGGVATVLVVALAAAPTRFGPETSRAARTRPPALAGTWYPGDRASLCAAAHLLMRVGAPDRAPVTKPVALVVPHAGWPWSGPVAGAAFSLLHPGDFDRVVVVGPSHHAAFRGYAVDDATAYRTPLGDVPLCTGSFAALSGEVARREDAATAPEHAVEIELPFLQAALGSFCLVPALVGDTDEADETAFAARLATFDDGRTLFVFSSDFSHYGPRFDYEPFGPLSPRAREETRALNERALDLLAAADAAGFRSHLRETGNTICGRRGLLTLLALLPRIAPGARGVTLAHYASADIPGVQDTSSVSYAAMAFFRSGAPSPSFAPRHAPPRLEDAPVDSPPLGPDAGGRLVRLARAALETRLGTTDTLDDALRDWPRGRDEEQRRGVFVTLNRTDPAEVARDGRLRGCIGQPVPTWPLYYGTVQAALDAALRDPRFPAVTASELPRLAVEVTVLSPRREIASYRDIRIGTHGVVLQKAGRSALFLPQVAPEQGWSVEQMLSALSEKAGLPGDAWREGARLEVFTGQVFEEGP